MSLFLINLQSDQQIPLKKENPLIIGRNNVLGCFDKKVSRSHGRITCTENGKINLVALHTNPCFFMKKGVPPMRQLNKDEEETLNEGDCLGLLPNSFWFQVSTSNAKIKKNLMVNSESRKDSETANSENIKESQDNTSETENLKFLKTGLSDYSKRIGSPEFEKTRRLPLSAYETDEIKVSHKYSNFKDCEIQAVDVKNNCNNEENCKEREEPSTSKVCTDETSANDDKAKKETSTQEIKGIEPDKSKLKRPICQYEFDCFRQNPQHKMHFSHPGDSDYVAFENRPFCQYGRACCRTNRRHKIEFRHEPARSSNTPLGSPSSRPPGSIASSPVPIKRRRKKVKRSPEYEDEEEDQYDLEDPFINDASSDEYVPSDLNSEEDLDESQETY